MSRDLLSDNPWRIDDAAFPRSGALRDQLAFCINYAVLAPSIHNTQPWLFRLLDDAVELHLDRSRMLPATDPVGREMTISCGAALTNLLVAIRYFGREVRVQYAPEPGNPDVLARVRPGRTQAPDYPDETLFRSIRRRRTMRGPFQNRPAPRDLQRRLIWQASEYGCWVHFMESDADRRTAGRLIERAQIQQLDDAAYQAERSFCIGSGDRVLSIGASGSIGASPEGLRWLERDRTLIRASPVLFALGSGADTPLDWFRTGEAIEYLLLQAATENLAASFLNQPCQIPALREELRLLTGRSGPPQALIRMGYGESVDPSPRRPVQDVILGGEKL